MAVRQALMWLFGRDLECDAVRLEAQRKRLGNAAKAAAMLEKLHQQGYVAANNNGLKLIWKGLAHLVRQEQRDHNDPVAVVYISGSPQGWGAVLLTEAGVREFCAVNRASPAVNEMAALLEVFPHLPGHLVEIRSDQKRVQRLLSGLWAETTDELAAMRREVGSVVSAQKIRPRYELVYPEQQPQPLLKAAELAHTCATRQ